MQLASRLNRFNEPETLKMAKLGRELRAQGIDITDLSLGEPDFITPKIICDAAKKQLMKALHIIRLFQDLVICVKQLQKNLKERIILILNRNRL